MTLLIPFAHSCANVRGGPAGTPIPVAGIRPSDRLLVLLSWQPELGVTLVAHDVTAFAVADGAIESATIDTGSRLFVVYHGAT